MDIQTRKIRFIQRFLKLQNDEAITELENLMKEVSKRLTEKELKQLSVEEMNRRISSSEKDFDNGNYKTTEQLLSKY